MKMSKSCVKHGHPTTLVVADGFGDEVREGVDIVDVGRPSGRVDRALNSTRKIYDRALDLRADIYHLHDPELLPVGVKLKKAGYKVIFDSHEDVPLQLLAKGYMHPLCRRAVSRVYGRYEAFACRKLDGIVTATPFIRDKFAANCDRVLDIANYPILDELSGSDDWDIKGQQVCYVGSIGRVRGIEQMCSALQHVKNGVSLDLIGQFDSETLRREVMELPGWEKVTEYGLLDRKAVKNVLSRAQAGLVTLHPIINYMDALPIKMFEYMSAGIPVIASDFPAWRAIVSGNGCGILVNPMQPLEIADAINTLLSDPGLAKHLGTNGRRAIEAKYNWASEEAKLFSFYDVILES